MAPSIRSLIAILLLVLIPHISAERLLRSTSLSTCQADSKFSASLFDVTFTPSNGTVQFDVTGTSTISGKILLTIEVYAYGYLAISQEINPCDSEALRGLCPMNPGPIPNLNSNFQIDKSSLTGIPGITYTVPDLDATVKVYFNPTTDGTSLACVEAELSNGKTVDQAGVAWALAVISGLALVASAVTSGLGHSNTAAHVAANTLALFGYFQAQAFIGMTAVDLPPIVASWTQNFQWSMGIIRVGFLQDIATWYQRSTGGTPSEILSNLSTTSVQVQKRSVEAAYHLMRRSAHHLAGHVMKRQSTSDASGTGSTSSDEGVVIVSGIERVGFRAGIEPTNIFLTGYIFFMVFVCAVVIGVVLFKFICEALVRAGRLKNDKFQDFRNGWTTVLKGIMYRIVLIGFPQMVVLCFWELTQDDSVAEMVLAIFTVFTMMCILGWASSKAIRLARRSIAMHKNPAYILYSDPVSLNKWGFLYVQFKATAYYFIVPVLVYLLVKGLFIAFGQGSGVAQAVALVVIEAVFLIAVCILTPYMDKKTNAFNISISVINFISACFLLVFSNVFNQPGLVTGVMGVVFFIYNAAFSTILVIIVLVASIIAITAKNPDTRYQPMRDDRGSFIKSQTNLNTELDALGATARGESKHGYGKGSRLDDDDEESWSGSDHTRQQTGHAGGGAPYSDGPRSPVMTSAPGYNPSRLNNGVASPYGAQSRTTSMTSQSRSRNDGANPSPWQRGAGYE